MCCGMTECKPNAGLKLPADRCPYEPLALLLRLPLTILAKEFGEYRIIELMSKESEYGEDDNARLRLTLARILPPGPTVVRPGLSRLK